MLVCSRNDIQPNMKVAGRPVRWMPLEYNHFQIHLPLKWFVKFCGETPASMAWRTRLGPVVPVSTPAAASNTSGTEIPDAAPRGNKLSTTAAKLSTAAVYQGAKPKKPCEQYNSKQIRASRGADRMAVPVARSGARLLGPHPLRNMQGWNACAVTIRQRGGMICSCSCAFLLLH